MAGFNKVLKDYINGVWATTFDSLIFVYVLKLNVITIRNYVNRFNANNMYSHLLQLQVHNSILVKSVIHIYFHKCGSPLEKAKNGNYFAYLEPFLASVDNLVNDVLQYSY